MASSLPYTKKLQLSCTVDRHEALRYLGYSNQKVDEELTERFEALALHCQQSIRPYCAWTTLAVDAAKSRWLGNRELSPIVVLENGLVLEGASINQHLRGATHVVLLACTLGLQSEQELRRLEATSPTDAVMFSAAGSSLVEAAAEAAEGLIRQQAEAAGLFCNWRYSPGYGDLPLSLQPKLLKALDAYRCLGLSATETYLLVPTKSITAILGLFPQQPDTVPPNPCDACLARQDCEYKKKGITCHGQ